MSTKIKKVLNLYAGIGGNRKLWTNVSVTAVEHISKIAAIYSDFYPNDEIIVTDAHQYLLDHYNEFDFIWSSTPCPTHSKARYWAHFGGKTKAVYPDMSLYQEILFLTHYFKGKWVVENVVPFYKPLIPGQEIGRHMFWSNFYISPFKSIDANINRGNIDEWQKLHGLDISKYNNIGRKDKILRNCVHPKTGLHILNESNHIEKTKKRDQFTFKMCVD